MINIDEFIKNLSISIKTLPTKELEPCDLSNEIGIIIANLAGSDKSLEMVVAAVLRMVSTKCGGEIN